MTLNLAHSAFIASAHNPTHSILTPVPSLPRSTHARPPRNPQPACPSCGGVRCLRSKPLSLVPHRRTIVAPSDAFLPPPPPSPPVCRDGQGARCDANSCCQLPPPPTQSEMGRKLAMPPHSQPGEHGSAADRYSGPQQPSQAEGGEPEGSSTGAWSKLPLQPAPLKPIRTDIRITPKPPFRVLILHPPS